MKKRILYTVLLAAGLAFSSCSDQFLQDMNPYDSYSPEKTFGIGTRNTFSKLCVFFSASG